LIVGRDQALITGNRPLPSARYRKIKSCSLVRFGLSPDSAAVAVNDALEQRQTHAGAFELFGSMQPLEYAEQFAGVRHVEADTIVAYKVLDPLSG
jgi:hypothetical protein